LSCPWEIAFPFGLNCDSKPENTGAPFLLEPALDFRGTVGGKIFASRASPQSRYRRSKIRSRKGAPAGYMERLLRIEPMSDPLAASEKRHVFGDR